MSDIRHWKEFEQLVAAIQRCTHEGAEVLWDKKIDGRQYDCIINFTYGMYDYRVVIECKKETRAIEVGAVEAFVIKSQKVRANKAIMVSRNGFQSGAIETAAAYNIELYQVEELDALPGHIPFEDQGVTPTIELTNFRLRDKQGRVVRQFSDKPNVLSFFMKNTFFITNGHSHSLDNLVNEYHSGIDQTATEVKKEFQLEIPTNQAMLVPQFDNPCVTDHLRINTLLFSHQIVQKPIIKSSLDINFQLKTIVYKGIPFGRVLTFSRREIVAGLDTQLEADKFYGNVILDACYFCEKIETGIATMHMIEAYQHGRFIQAAFQIDISQEKQYIKISDKKAIRRLSRIYDYYKKQNR